MEAVERLQKIARLAAAIENECNRGRDLKKIFDFSNTIRILAEQDAKFIQVNLEQIERDLKRIEK